MADAKKGAEGSKADSGSESPVLCPSCGHDIHGKPSCSFCGADTVEHRVKEVTLVAIALMLIFAGIGCYVLASLNTVPDTRDIGSLGEEDAYDHIRVVGKVVDAPSFYADKYDPETGTVRIRVNDTTGEMNVKLEKPVVKHIRETGEVPSIGDVVEARGTLYVGDDFLQLTVITPDFLKIKSREYAPMTVDSLAGTTPSDIPEFTLVEVNGTVSGVRKYSFATMFYLEDAEGDHVTVFMQDSIIQLTAGGIELESVYQGARVRIEGALVWYVPRGAVTGYWELVPTSAQSIIAEAPLPFVRYPVYTLEQLMMDPEANEGLLVRIQNVTVYEYSNSYLFKVVDMNSGYNVSVYVEPSANITGEVGLDSVVTMQGVLAKYFDLWEIKIRLTRSDFVMEVPQ